jgi:hypothetical protein
LKRNEVKQCNKVEPVDLPFVTVDQLILVKVPPVEEKGDEYGSDSFKQASDELPNFLSPQFQ